MNRIAALILLCLVSSLATGRDCPTGVPYEPKSALAGSGFNRLPEPVPLPEGWDVFWFSGRSVPIPIWRTERIAIIRNGRRVGSLLLQGPDGNLLWKADLTNRIDRHGRTGVPIEQLLRSAISGEASEGRKMSESECLEAAVALVTLDLFSDEHSAAAYDTGTLLIIEGYSWQGNRWDAFWREENDRLAYVSWNLPREQLGVLGHLSTDSQSHAKGQDFQKWLSCIQSESLSSCKDTGLTDIEVIVYSENMERLSE